MKRLMFLIALMTGVTAAFADCTFTDVIVRQHWPWNSKVEVEMAVAGTGGRRHLVKIAAYSGGTLLGEIPGGKPVACDSRLTFTFDPTEVDFLKNLGAIHDFRVVPSARQVVDIPYLTHRWTFNNTLEDEVGGQDATAKNANLSAKTVSVTGGSTWGTSYVELGANALPKSGPVTVEFWASRDNNIAQSYLFDVGKSTDGEAITDDRLSFVPRNNGTTQIAIQNGGYNVGNKSLEPNGMMTLGTIYHVAIVLVPASDGGTTVTAYLQDATTGETLKTVSWDTTSACSFWNITQNHCWLGRSSFNREDAAATYDEVRVWNAALTKEELERNARLGPDALPIP